MISRLDHDRVPRRVLEAVAQLEQAIEDHTEWYELQLTIENGTTSFMVSLPTEVAEKMRLVRDVD